MVGDRWSVVGQGAREASDPLSDKSTRENTTPRVCIFSDCRGEENVIVVGVRGRAARDFGLWLL